MKIYITTKQRDKMDGGKYASSKITVNKKASPEKSCLYTVHRSPFTAQRSLFLCLLIFSIAFSTASLSADKYAGEIFRIAFSTASLSADKYAGEIFRIGAGVRNFALGNTGVTDYNSTSLAYWNASLLAKSSGSRFELMHSEEFMGAVNYDIFSAVWGEQNRYSIVISRIGIDDIPLTRLKDPDAPVSPENRPYIYKTVNNADYIAYFGFYRSVGDYFIGFTPKVAYRYLAESSGFGFGADISTHLKISNNLLMGINIRDFFATQVIWQDSDNEIINPGIDLEFKLSFPNPLFNNRGNLYAGTEILMEDRKEAATHSAGIFSFDYHIGLEIPLPDFVKLYAGYDVDSITTGLSININHYNLNYAFRHNTALDNSHRVSLGLNF